MSNPETKKADEIDPLLSLDGAISTGKLHAGDMDTKNYLVSPLYGSYAGLGKISVFTGTNDVLNPDAHTLKQLAAEEGIVVDLYEYEHMIHDWLLFSMPEATMAINQIADLIKY